MKRNFVAKAATLAVALIMAAGLVACDGESRELIPDRPKILDENGEIEKPKSIKLITDTGLTEENRRDLFMEEYEKLTGIKLVIEQPAHNQYYEKINLSFAGGRMPDAMEVGNTYYPNYVNYGALFDMTKAWEESDLKNGKVIGRNGKPTVVDEKYVDALKINGKLYGFPMTRGNGTVTYVRKDWMEQLNIDEPKSYDEFLDMLRAFKSLGPDIVPLTSAGLINTETPYDIYLREFYQDAHPDFYKNSEGVYVDGMSQPNMIDALQRFQDAYAEGLIDREIITNKTSTCRNKFYDGKVGAFNYWAGQWCHTLNQSLKIKFPDAEAVPLTPINDSALYIERPPTAVAITTACENPYGVFKWICEYSHDGGEGQMLFSHGVEGVHYETKDDGTVVALTPPASPGSKELVEKAWYAPELTITSFETPIYQQERKISSLKMFSENSTLNEVPKMTLNIADAMVEISTVRAEIIAKVVRGDMTPEEGIKDYESRCKYEIETMLSELNGK